MANLTWGATRTSGTMLAWLFSGLFQRFPNLKIALSEGEIGWIPYFLERAEQVLDKQRHWVLRGQQFGDHATSDVDFDKLDIRASFRDHVFGCFIEDHHGDCKPRRDRRGQRHVRDGLSALRLNVAGLHRHRKAGHQRPIP